MHPAIPIAMVFVGCCSNVVFLEYLVKSHPGSGSMITFSQFLFIALEGFIFTTKFGRVKPVIPISRYIVMVVLFFVVQVSNNYAFNFNISVPLHTIFRAGSLIANLVLGVILLKRSYKLSKYFAVIMITAGIVICTMVSASDSSNSSEESDEEGGKDAASEYFMWLMGVGVLTFALFMSARMGIYQEQVYKQYGKHPSEALFYNHALPLPGFAFLANDIYQHTVLFNQSTPVDMPVGGLTVPIMWLFLAGNVLTQYMCIKSVFILTTECTSLTVTLVVTLRKFVSLLFSIWYFSNPFTPVHWLGTSLVFGGTIIFTEAYAFFMPAKEKTN